MALEIPNSKSQAPNKSQQDISKPQALNLMAVSFIVYRVLEFVWDLVLGIWDFSFISGL
jgi:hypothetical protein